jgi:hypothetical protein
MKVGMFKNGFMKRISFLLALWLFLSFESNSQDIKVIELEPVEIIPSDQISVYSNFTKKHRENKANGLGSLGNKQVAIVSGFLNPVKDSIQLEGLEFFFNYKWDQDSSGFYVQPVVVKEDGLPLINHTDFPEKYLVTSKLKNRLYIDLSAKGISMAPNERLLVGFKFLENLNPEIPNSYNITFINGKVEEYTYLLYPDGRKPEEVIGPGKHSAGLKYSVVYKLKE